MGLSTFNPYTGETSVVDKELSSAFELVRTVAEALPTLEAALAAVQPVGTLGLQDASAVAIAGGTADLTTLSVSTAPADPTDVVRLTDLQAAQNTVFGLVTLG
jgi:hypothetical protein